MGDGKRQGGAQAQCAPRFAALPGDALLDLFDFGQQAQGRFVIALAQRCSIQTPRRAVEQTHAKPLLQLHQAATDKLLGQPELVGRGREAAGFHHLAKDTHVFKRVHRHGLSELDSI